MNFMNWISIVKFALASENPFTCSDRVGTWKLQYLDYNITYDIQ